MKPKQHASTIVVIGLGYVGLPLALLFVKKQFQVIGIDNNLDKINKLNQGKSYFPEIADEEIKKAQRGDNLVATTDYEEIKKADTIIICVPTPLTEKGTPDLSYLEDVAYHLAPQLQKEQLVILESSTYPGTTEEVLQPLLEKGSQLVVGKDFYLSYSPERMDPGNKEFKDIHNVSKVVSGVTTNCSNVVIQKYSKVFTDIVSVSSPKVAEFTKLLENSYRYINISFINELTRMADKLNIDLWEAIDAASTKPFGFSSFYPGPGIGGHCIPIDPIYLSWKGKQVNVDSQFIQLAQKMNHLTKEYIINQLSDMVPGDLTNKHILIYGVAYKKDIDDIRESPALSIMESLMKKGVKVSYHDPFVPNVKTEAWNLHSTDLTDKNLSNLDAVVILTDHSQIPVQKLLDHAPLVYDTRNVTKGYLGNAQVVRLGGGSS